MKRSETCHASFERQYVKAFFLRSGTKWYRQSDKYKNSSRETIDHQSEIIAVGNAGNDLAMIDTEYRIG
jgi:hypothetical protein